MKSRNGLTSTEVYRARAQRWRNLAGRAPTEAARAAYAELASAYERLAALSDVEMVESDEPHLEG
jgi:hypothetical protein